MPRPDADAVLDAEMVRKSLSRYFAVIQNSKPAKFAIAKKLPATFNEEDSLEALWKEHENFAEEFGKAELEIDDEQNPQAPEKSYLDLKSAIANRILQHCHLCNRKCGANRTKAKTGYCKCGNTIAISSIFAHMCEEPELVPSGTIFTMRCLHCQNWTIPQWMENSVEFMPRRLAAEVKQLRFGGCRNVNLVGGEPTPWLGHWLETFKHVNANVPVVWAQIHTIAQKPRSS